MTNVNANINISVNSQQAIGQLRALQTQISALNKGVLGASASAHAQQSALNKALMDGANSSRAWNASLVPMNSSLNQFSTGMDKGTLSLGQYSKAAVSQLPGMSRIFKREFGLMSGAATANVKRMQTQYLALGRSAGKAQMAMAFAPTALNAQAAHSAIATQKQVLFNRAIDLGSTKLLNWGKNTQWAGRQLMVGLTLPLALMGKAAAKAFKEIDKAEVSFKRVYGDLSTTTSEMESNLAAIKDLGKEYTKYGLALSETIDLSARVAATGAQNEGLLAATEQTLRLATLGMMEYDQALDATIALQTAFGVSNEDLATTIDFLNVVENETILTMEDMAAAIPRVAPVIRGLGGDVQDLAVFMTAMREGGVTAEQGANALKSGLARMINPTKAAREQLDKYGISIDAIVNSNKGDIMATVQEFGAALSTLGEFEQQQSLEKVFGKYQYARLGALFKNLSNDASQANRSIELTNMSIEDLASISDKELSKIEEATSTKFAASMERLKISIAPVGEAFMKALLPIIGFVSKIIEKFNNLPDNIKNAVAIAIGLVAGIGPVVLMLVGLFANGIANIVKFIQLLRKGLARLKGDTSAFKHLTIAEQDASAAAISLEGQTKKLTSNLVLQQEAVTTLIGLFNRYAESMVLAGAAAPLAMAPTGGMAAGAAAAVAPKATGGFRFSPAGFPRKYAGGVASVPGVGNKDTVPALLTPGESVITKKATKKYAPIIEAMNAGTIQGFAEGAVDILGNKVSMSMRRASTSKTVQIRTEKVISDLVDDGVSMGRALDRVTKVLTKFAATGENITGEKAKKIFQEEGLTRSSRTLSASHLTPDISMSDPRVQQTVSQQSPEFQKFAQENPSYVKGTSKLTATLPALLNQQLRTNSGANLDTFKQKYAQGGSDKLFNSAQMMDKTILADEKSAKALQSMERAIGRRAEAIARQTGAQGVQDKHMVQATEEVIKKYQGLSASSQRATKALTQAGSSIGQLRIQAPVSDVREGVSSGKFVQRGRSVETRGGVQVARDMGKRPATNIPINGGLAVATASQQRALLDKTMGDSSKIVKRTTGRIAAETKSGLGERSASTIAKKFGVDWNRGLAIGLEESSSIPVSEAKETAAKVSSAAKTMLSADKSKQIGSTIGSGLVGTKPKISYSPQAQQALGLQPSVGFAKQTSKEISTVFKEVSSIFRTIPKFAAESIRVIKPVFSSIGRAFLELNPGLLEAVGAIKHFFTQISYTWMGVKSVAAQRAKSAYENVMFNTMLAWEKVKALPSRVSGAYETGMLKTLYALDSVKRLPQRIINTVQSIDFKKMGERLKNKAFYGGQDVAGRMKERLRPIKDFASKTAGVLGNKVPRSLATAMVMKSGKESLGNAVKPVKDSLSRLSQSISKGAVKISGVVQLLADPLGRAVVVSVTTKKIMGNLSSGMDLVKSKLAPMGTALTNAYSTISKFTQLMMDPLGRAIAITVAVDKTKQAFFNAAASVRDGGVRVYESMLWGAVKIIEGIERVPRALSTLSALIKSGGANLYESMLLGGVSLVEAAEKVAFKVKTEWDRVVQVLRSSNIKKSIIGAGVGIKLAASTARTNITQSFRNIGSAVMRSGKLVGTLITEAGVVLATSIKTAASRLRVFMNTGKLDADGNMGNSRLARMKSGGQGAMMGIMGLSMAASMASGEIGEMAQKIMPVSMGLMSLQMVIPMLTNPIGLAIIAITALVGSFIWMRKTLDDSAKEAARAAAGFGGAANRMESVGEAFGYDFAKDRVKDRSFSFTEKDKKGQSEFDNYFGSESGKKFLKDLKDSTSEERYSKISSQISFAIADGLDPERAKSFAQGIAYEIEDSLLNSKIMSDFKNGTMGSGSKAMVELIEKRQGESSKIPSADWRDNADFSKRAVESAMNPMYEGVNFLTRGLADMVGTTNTAVDILGKAALTVGIGAASGAAVGSVGAGVGAVPGAIVGTIVGVAAATAGVVDDFGQLDKNNRAVAAGLGSTIQILKEVDNAEALLTEERRSGLITVKEGAKRQAELNKIKDVQSEILSKSIKAQVDVGAGKTAISSSLVLGGFEKDIADVVADATDKDVMANKMFNGKDFKDLIPQEKEFVNTAIADIFSGLTPENAAEKIAKVETIYKKMGEDLQGAAMDGLSLSDFQKKSENLSIAQAVNDILYDGTESSQPDHLDPRTNVGEDAAKNIKELDLDALGVTTNELISSLVELGDKKLFKDIVGSTEDLKEFSILLVELEGLNGIEKENAFKAMKEEGIGALRISRKIKKSIKEISDIKLNKKIFGSAALDAQAITNALMESGEELDSIPGKVVSAVSTATQKIKGLSKTNLDEFGNIKINTEIVTQLFGKGVDADGLAKTLKAAFPKNLPPATLPIILSLMNPEMLTALAGLSPGAQDAIRGGLGEGGTYVGAPGTSFAAGSSQVITAEHVAAVKAYDIVLGLSPDVPMGKELDDDTKDKSGGGGSKATTPLKDLKKTITDRLAIYGNLTKLGKKLADSKKKFGKFLGQMTTKGSLAQKLRDWGINEQMIADIISKGPKEASKLIKNLGKTKDERKSQAKRLSKLDSIGRIQERTFNLGGDAVRATNKTKAEKRLTKEGFSEKEIKEMLQDEDLMTDIANLPKKAGKTWKEFFGALRTSTDEAKDPTDKYRDAIDNLNKSFEEGIKPLDDKIEKQEDLIDSIEDEIGAIEKLNDVENDSIRSKQRDIEMINRQVEAKEKLNKADKESSDKLKRNSEIRSRVSSAISHDLQVMGDAETEIKDAYDKRLESLEKVESVNKRILEQQKGQLGLAQALSQGDIYAATQSVQEIRAGNAQYAMDNTRNALQKGMENQVDSLRTSGGLTRLEAEKQMKDITEQNYQTGLLVRDIEDRVYQRNLDIIPLKSKIAGINMEIRDLEDIIYGRETQILEITRKRLEPQQEILNGLTTQRTEMENILDANVEALEIQIDNAEMTDAQRKKVDDLATSWHEVNKQIATANTLMETKKTNAGLKPNRLPTDSTEDYKARVEKWKNKIGKIKEVWQASIDNAKASGIKSMGELGKSSGGMINGEGSRDSVPARLTPGEFVVRKSMVNKYGIPMLGAINQGSFKMPKYDTGGAQQGIEIGSVNNNSANISAPMYNNYSVNVSATTNANPDEIATAAVMKIKQMQNMQVRSSRGN